MTRFLLCCLQASIPIQARWAPHTLRALDERLETFVSIGGRMTCEMPRNRPQALYFMLGILLAFYFLTPFLELAVR
jgi:hypothetical protein